MGERRSVGIRELQRDTSAVVKRVTRTGRPTFVTNRGETVAVVYPVDADALEEFALANAPAFVRAMTAADVALVKGRTRPARDMLPELTDELPPPERTRALRATTGRRATTDPVLTERERLVLEHLAAGLTNGQIAETLSISPTTARRDVQHILEKLGSSSHRRSARLPVDSD